MTLPIRIARRYLFAKKSTNAINIITGIAIFGIAVGTAALILVLSVFNGFEDLITDMYSRFNPDIKVTPVAGKTFVVDSTVMAKLPELEGVEYVAQTVEEVAFFGYKDNRDFGILKGCDDQYVLVTGLDSTIREGKYALLDGERNMTVMGLGMRNKLGVNIDDLFSPVTIYMAKRETVGMFEQQFRSRLTYPAGTFITQQDYDSKYVLTNLELAQELLALDGEIGAIEIKLSPGASVSSTQEAVQQLVGDAFEVENRYQQQEAFMKLMQLEKWLSYAIVSLMLLMVAFNMVGALWMIVLEKKKDIAILRSMGATTRLIRDIFLSEGLLLSLVGLVIGIVLTLTIYWIQTNYGLIGIPGEMMLDAYPVSLRWIDFIIVSITVVGIGLLASVPPALRAQRVPAMIREE
jgi:lipoprotein-releasing system permease protein